MFALQKNDLKKNLIKFDPTDCLGSIKAQLNSQCRFIHLDGFFKFTKTQKNYTQATLIRDLELEQDVKDWIAKRSGGFSSLMNRYNDYDKMLLNRSWPEHFAMRILKGGGSICSGDNIFMFFPEVLGLSTGKIQDYFGFEFIDVWQTLFNQIVFPCIKITFGISTQEEVSRDLRCALDKTIFLASVFHEIGHRTGPWRVSPTRDSDLQITPFQIDVLGELSTDSLLVKNLREFPEVAQFVFFQRIFWFARRGFGHDPISGKLNADNDAWIGAYLWNKFRAMDLIINRNGLWVLQTQNLVRGFDQVLAEIDALAIEIRTLTPHQQVEHINSWMRIAVEFDENIGFILPDDLIKMFLRCQDILEKPHFQPPIQSDTEGF